MKFIKSNKDAPMSLVRHFKEIGYLFGFDNSKKLLLKMTGIIS